MPSTLGIVAAAKIAGPPPIPTTGLAGWWDAADLATITAAAGAVSEWRDKSGGNFHLTQATAAAKPTTGTATQNGRNVFVFDGGDVLNYTGATINVGNASLFIVFRFASPSGWSGIFSAHPATGDDNNSSNGFALEAGNGGNTPELFRGNAGPAVAAPAVGTWILGTATMATASDEVVLTLNGSSISRVAGTPPYGVASGYVVGGRFAGGAILPNARHNGQVAEVILYNRALSTVERQQVEQYLKTKWGTP